MRPNFGRTERSQPPMIPGDQRSAGGRQGDRRPGHLEDQRADQRADHDRRADERHVGDIGRTVGDTQHLGGGGNILRAADKGEQVAAIDLGARQDGDIGGGSAARDLAQEHAARRRARRQLLERLAVDLLVRYQDVDALHRHGEQFAVLDFDRRCPEDVHQHFALARDRHHVAFLQDDVRGRIHDLAPAPNAQDEEARIGHQRLSLGDAQTGGFATRLHLVGAQRPACPGRARTAQLLLAAPMLLLVVLAGGDEIDAQQLRADDGDHDRRAHGAEHVGHGVSDRHVIEVEPWFDRRPGPAG